jgi:prepilin-type N-terminal cleavage/methylation domain-containing protein
MEASMSIRKKRRQGGFALIEVMIAIAILAVGLLGCAALMAQLFSTTTQSRYLGAQVMLASEKLEDLTQLRYSAYKTAQLAAGGNLTSDNTVNGIPYFDQVQISSRSGMISDPTDPSGGGANDMLTFKRRWVIESDTPTARVQRITVIIIPLTGSPVERAETFQTSTVRPCDATSGC